MYTAQPFCLLHKLDTFPTLCYFSSKTRIWHISILLYNTIILFFIWIMFLMFLPTRELILFFIHSWNNLCWISKRICCLGIISFQVLYFSPVAYIVKKHIYSNTSFWTEQLHKLIYWYTKIDEILRIFLLFNFLKLAFIIFIYFTKRKHLRNYEKCSLLYWKSFYVSRNIQIFVLLSTLLFSPVSYCWIYWRRWQKINPKVYDIIICIKWNLKVQII